MDFLNVDGTIICRVPSDNILDSNEVEQIVKHTINTWQKGRKPAEIRKDTIQGKKAEYVLEKYLHEHSMSRYVSYDKFRRDSFEKHAPFDGLIVQKDIDPYLLNDCIEKTNADVANNKAGQISETLRAEFESKGIYTLEIKSSSLKKNDYDGITSSGREMNSRTMNDYFCITQNIKRWDYFVYPHYIRSSESINSFYDYAEYVRHDNRFNNDQKGNQAFLHDLIVSEYKNACDIYTRLYFDYETGEIYIPGYIKKEKFYEKPYISHMSGPKSGRALYYMRSIADGRSFLELDKDKKEWNFGTMSVYEQLFAVGKRKCRKCGSDLKICNVQTRLKYSYKCFECGAWYEMDEINTDTNGART